MKLPKTIPSVVYRCTRCKRWAIRMPDTFDWNDKDCSCDGCGCTSFTVKPGRPYGPRSRKWKLAMEDWKEYHSLPR